MNRMYWDERRIDLCRCAFEFYTLFDLKHAIERKHRNLRIYSMVDEELKQYADELAHHMYNYLCVTAMGEAGHSRNHCGTTVEYNGEFWNMHTRSEKYRDAFKFNPKQFLPLLLELFSSNDWNSSYGGTQWGKAVELTMKYGQISNILFIDRAMWLQHNSNCIFDKGIIFSINNLYKFLNYRQKENILDPKYGFDCDYRQVLEGCDCKTCLANAEHNRISKGHIIVNKKISNFLFRAKSLGLQINLEGFFSSDPITWLRFPNFGTLEINIIDNDIPRCENCGVYTDDTCGECGNCEDHCHCSYCSCCGEKTTGSTCGNCGYCEGCCECVTCESCEEKIHKSKKKKYFCSECDYCKDCCTCEEELNEYEGKNKEVSCG